MGREACSNLIKKVIPLKMTKTFQICSDGCYLYRDDNETQVDCCPVCKKTTKKSTKIVSITEKIVEMLSCDEIRDNLLERQRERTNNSTDINATNSSYGDIYDGQLFKDLYASKVINNDPDILNIYLKLDVDGFTASSSRSSMIMIHAVVLNLDSSEKC